jgi:uncharacterized protein (DUF1778 family)
MPIPKGVRTSYVHWWDMSKVAKSRWNFRVAPDADEVVRHAASVSNRPLTDFVLQAAVNEAERVIADRTRFALDPEGWNRFTELLDRPVQENPGLAKLFARPSVFE